MTARTVEGTFSTVTSGVVAVAVHDGFYGATTGLRSAAGAGGKIAATSTYMRGHLTRDYDLPIGSFIDLFNGFTPADLDDLASPFPFPLPDRARGGFLLGLGRAEAHKGWDDLLDAVGLLRSRCLHLPHLLLAAVTPAEQPTPYQQHLARRIAAERLDATLITRYHDAFRRLLDHSGLAAVIVPSRVEPFGRVPLEARDWSISPGRHDRRRHRRIRDRRRHRPYRPARPSALAGRRVAPRLEHGSGRPAQAPRVRLEGRRPLRRHHHDQRLRQPRRSLGS